MYTTGLTCSTESAIWGTPCHQEGNGDTIVEVSRQLYQLKKDLVYMTLSRFWTHDYEKKSNSVSAYMQPSQSIDGLNTCDSCHATDGGCAIDLK